MPNSTTTARAIVIGDLTFATKKAATEYFRTMLYRYEMGAPVSPEDAATLAELLKQHPTCEQKRGGGVLGFCVGGAPRDARAFWIFRTDGTTTDFSYRKCIDTPPTPLARVLRAMRKEVTDDILAKKREYFEAHGDELGRIKCPLTSELVTIEQAHADHAPPRTFHTLATMFLGARDLEPSEAMLMPPADDRFGRSLVDRALAADWLRFHHKHAVVRIVAAFANISRGHLSKVRAADRQLTFDLEGGAS